MSQTAKTIQIYLPKGNPRGLRVAEMTTRTVRLIEIPRVDIHDFFARDDANQVGIYFLLSDSEEFNRPKLYIGQTGELKRRLSQHHIDTKKEFWTRAFVMLSTNNTMTQTHALYLEHKAIKTAQDVGRYDLQNGNHGNRPHTPDPLKADCEELFYTLDVLLSTLGQPVFESLTFDKSIQAVINNTADLDSATNGFDNKKSSQFEISPDALDTQSLLNQELPKQESPTLFYCKTKNADAKGYFNEDGFVILAGSIIRKSSTSSLGSWAINEKAKLVKENKLIDGKGDTYQLTCNHLFKTPSGAGQFATGRPTNGWVEWKNKDGQTLDSVYR